MAHLQGTQPFIVACLMGEVESSLPEAGGTNREETVGAGPCGLWIGRRGPLFFAKRNHVSYFPSGSPTGQD